MTAIFNLLLKRFGLPRHDLAFPVVQISRAILTSTQIVEADIGTQARLAAAQVAKTAQYGAKGATDTFNRFVEGEGSSSTRRVPIDESKRDFWDSFGKPAEAAGPSAIGTAAMRGNAAAKKDGDDWEKW